MTLKSVKIKISDDDYDVILTALHKFLALDDGEVVQESEWQKAFGVLEYLQYFGPVFYEPVPESTGQDDKPLESDAEYFRWLDELDRERGMSHTAKVIPFPLNPQF